MSCDDADLLLAAHAVGSLTAAEARPLDDHLRHCRRCRAVGSSYLQVASLLPLALEQVEPPPALRRRILAVVYAEAAAEAQRRSGRRAAPASSTAWQRLVGLGTALRRRHLGLAVTVAAAVAAVVVALTTRPPAAPAPVTAHACGLTAQPSACGTLTYFPETRQAVLSVDGLAPLPVVGGRPTGTYEVWLIRRNGAAAPAAFLAPSPAGRTWVAAMNADLAQVVAIAATVEPPGGSPQPTGTEVLRIAVPATQ